MPFKIKKDKEIFLNNKGFTLIELLITIFVLVAGIVAVLQAFPLGIRITTSGQMVTIATQLAQGKIEQELSNSYSDLLVGTTTEDYDEITDFNGYKRITKINCVNSLDLSEVSCDYDLINDPLPMKQIEVTMFWNSPFATSEDNIKLVTIISRK